MENKIIEKYVCDGKSNYKIAWLTIVMSDQTDFKIFLKMLLEMKRDIL